MRLKRFAFLAAVAAGVLFGFNACEKDDGVPAPTFTFKDKNDNTVINEVTEIPFVIHVSVDPATKLEKLVYNFSYKQGADNSSHLKEPKVLWTQENASSKTLIHRFGEKKDGQPETGLLPAGISEGTLIFTATDKNGGVTTREITVKLGSPQTPVETKFEDKTTDGEIYHITGEGTGSYNLKDGKAMGIDEVKANKANVYMINNSPKDGNFNPGWTSGSHASVLAGAEGNGTKYAKVTVNFDEVSVENALKAHKDANPSTTVDKVATKGEIYVGVKDSEIYLIKIEDFDTTTKKRSGTGVLKFKYKKGTIPAGQ